MVKIEGSVVARWSRYWERKFEPDARKRRADRERRQVIKDLRCPTCGKTRLLGRIGIVCANSCGRIAQAEYATGFRLGRLRRMFPHLAIH